MPTERAYPTRATNRSWLGEPFAGRRHGRDSTLTAGAPAKLTVITGAIERPHPSFVYQRADIATLSPLLSHG